MFYKRHLSTEPRYCPLKYIGQTERTFKIQVHMQAERNNGSNTVEVEVNLRPTVSRPVCPGVRRPSGTRDQYLFILEISFRQLRLCYFVVHSLTRGRVCYLL
jgi:hypothetical protein